MIYVNGDSYTVMSGGKVYSDYLKEKLNTKSINAGIPGSCNSRIFRTSLRDLIELKKTEKDITAIISLSFTIRSEVWDENIQPTKWKNSNDGGFASYQFVTGLDWLGSTVFPSELKSYAKEWVTQYNIEAETTTLLQQSVLLSNWCKLNNVRLILLSSCLQEPVDFNTPFIKPFYDELFVDKNVINFFTSSFVDICKDFPRVSKHIQEIHGKKYDIGHINFQGHEYFANFLIENYLNEI